MRGNSDTGHSAEGSCLFIRDNVEYSLILKEISELHELIIIRVRNVTIAGVLHPSPHPTQSTNRENYGKNTGL